MEHVSNHVIESLILQVCSEMTIYSEQKIRSKEIHMEV